jgi:hypothetical protein
MKDDSHKLLYCLFITCKSKIITPAILFQAEEELLSLRPTIPPPESTIDDEPQAPQGPPFGPLTRLQQLAEDQATTEQREIAALRAATIRQAEEVEAEANARLAQRNKEAYSRQKEEELAKAQAIAAANRKTAAAAAAKQAEITLNENKKKKAAELALRKLNN